MVFTVTLNKSGNSFNVDEAETVLDAALRTGHIIPYSCRSGSCGSCKARILSGSIDYGAYAGNILTDTDRARGMALLCQAHPLQDLVIEAREVAVAEEIEIKLLPCRVMQLEKLNHDVMRLSLKLPQNQKFNYLAGQYIDILLRDGRRRSFSIANAPRQGGELELHVRRVPDGYFTNQIFSTMKERDLLRLQGPLGTFFLRQESDRPVLFMAGGTGFAPIKAIMEHAIEEEIKRPMHIFWGARTERDLYLDDLARRWADQYEHVDYTPVLSEVSPDSDWSGKIGWVHEVLLQHYPNLDKHEVYMAGPPPMIDAAYSTFVEHGLAEDNLYFDSFEFAADPLQP